MSDFQRLEGKLRDAGPAEHIRPGLPQQAPLKPFPQSDHATAREVPAPAQPPISLIGRTIVGRRRFPLAALILALLAMPLLISWLALPSPAFLLVALLPLLVALALFLARPSAFSCTVTDQGLQLTAPSLFLGYEQIEEVYARSGRRSESQFPIHLIHRLGYVEVPACLDISSDEFYRFLDFQCPGRFKQRPVPEVLERYQRLQETLFQPDEIWVYHGSTTRPKSNSHRYAAAVCFGIAAAGLLWIVLGLMIPSLKDWIVGGVFVLILGGIFALIFLLAALLAPGRFKIRQEAGLVVSPGGFALVQGKLTGELKWSEVRQLKRRTGSGFSWSGGEERGPGLLVQVPGANILIADIYNRPIDHIHDVFEQFWRHRRR